VAVIVLRVKRPDARRPFKVAGGPIIPILGVLSCVTLMFTLSVMTWVRFLLWLDIGMLIYWFYGRTHSSLADKAERAARTPLESFANLLIVLGGLVTFNGFAMTVLGLLTEVGLTPETLARWSELDEVIRPIGLHINPEIADTFGLRILLTGIVVTVIGIVLSRSVRKRPTAAV
jgi:hypothetical protein